MKWVAQSLNGGRAPLTPRWRQPCLPMNLIWTIFTLNAGIFSVANCGKGHTHTFHACVSFAEGRWSSTTRKLRNASQSTAISVLLTPYHVMSEHDRRRSHSKRSYLTISVPLFRRSIDSRTCLANLWWTFGINGRTIVFNIQYASIFTSALFVTKCHTKVFAKFPALPLAYSIVPFQRLPVKIQVHSGGSKQAPEDIKLV